jgi:integrase/recombinase XerC
MNPAPAAERIEAYLDELTRLRRLSGHTVAGYRRDLAHLALAAGERPLAEIGAHEVRRCVAQLHGQGLGPASLARLLSAWRGFFKWLGQRGEIEANPAAGVRAPRRPKRLPKALSADQAVSLAAFEGDGSWLARRDHALVELLYSSGLRLAELVSLDWRAFAAGEGLPASVSWLDLDSGEATLLGKGRKQRTVPVGAQAVQALRGWLAVRGERARPAERALFVSERGTRLAARSVQLRLARLAREAGLGVPVHPHVLRHSFASHLLQSSGDLRAVQELLGHANIATTQIYTQLDWQHLARAYDSAHPRAKRKS